MAAERTPSFMFSVPPALVALVKVGVCRVAKLISAKSIASLPVRPATVPLKLAELSSFNVPVGPKNVT